MFKKIHLNEFKKLITLKQGQRLVQITTEAKQQNPKFELVRSLHDHWYTADCIYVCIKSIYKKNTSKFRRFLRKNATLDIIDDYFLLNVQCVFYALWYVVIEGYREINLPDSDIEKLLENEKAVELLRRFRNGIFHYQKNIDSPKVSEFLADGENIKWLGRLGKAFKAYFRRHLKYEELKDTILNITNTR